METSGSPAERHEFTVDEGQASAEIDVIRNPEREASTLSRP